MPVTVCISNLKSFIFKARSALSVDVRLRQITFFFLNIFRITQNNWINVNYTPLEDAVSNFLWALLVHINFLNNSCNFILYILTAPSFRKQLIGMFTKIKVKVNSRWTSAVAPATETQAQ